MAKNRNKKSKNSSASMDCTEGPTIASRPEAMDTSETAAPRPFNPPANRPKVKKGVVMKKSKNVRKKKSIAKAISRNEQSMEKALKNVSKTQRTQSAKNLYE